MLAMLREYLPEDAGERAMRSRILEFVEAHENCCERTLANGHMTGSAWVVDSERRHALLTHHKKLNRWLQMGGHADGSPDLLAVALREVAEESGQQRVRVLSRTPFDVDVHLIPERGTEAAHYHYDVRFLMEADRNEPLVVSEESHALAWVPLQDLKDADESLARMVRKTR
jgi:8-oxo-dGTP pyrophosphatase MutT (NUDIX family)